MIRYTLKRLARSLFTLLIIITVVFSLLRLMPVEGYFQNFEKMSDAAIQNGLRRLGLLDPLPVQLLNFFRQLLRGNLGVSNIYRVNVPITQIIAEKAPVSMMMGGIALCVSLLVGLPMGAAMARGKGKIFDKIGTGFVVLVQAVPSAVYYLVIQLYGTQIPGLRLPMLFRMDNPASWILPTLSLSIGNIAYYAMWLRRFMVDEMNKDYVTLARAKGHYAPPYFPQRLCAVGTVPAHLVSAHAAWLHLCGKPVFGAGHGRAAGRCNPAAGQHSRAGVGAALFRYQHCGFVGWGYFDGTC